jgi:hypothetical protein
MTSPKPTSKTCCSVCNKDQLREERLLIGLAPKPIPKSGRCERFSMGGFDKYYSVFRAFSDGCGKIRVKRNTKHKQLKAFDLPNCLEHRKPFLAALNDFK